MSIDPLTVLDESDDPQRLYLIWDQGYDAAAQKISLAKNPYSAGSPEADWWKDGWQFSESGQYEVVW